MCVFSDNSAFFRPACVAMLDWNFCSARRQKKKMYEGCWPIQWRYHLIVPILKDYVAYAAGNYRGVRLTPILSKFAEMVIDKSLREFLQVHHRQKSMDVHIQT